MIDSDWQTLIDRYAAIPARLRAAFDAIGPARWDTPATDGGWSARAVLDHIRACDGLETPRLLWLMVRDELPVAGIDHERLADLLHAQGLEVPRALAHFQAQRQELIGALQHLPEQHRKRTLHHEEYGPRPIADLVRHNIWHEEEHCAQLEALFRPQDRQPPSNVQASYDAVAEGYADHYFDELAHKPFDCRLLDWLIERAERSGLICDLGCGPGHIAHYLNAHGAQVYGIDLSPEMVKQARLRSPDIAFAQGNMLALDSIAAGTFASIAAFYSIVNLTHDELPRAFAELGRVLVPGGWLLLSFHVGDETRHLDEWLEQPVSLNFTFFTPEAIQHALTSAGFEVTETIVRSPYPGLEYPSQRAYVFARSHTRA